MTMIRPHTMYILSIEESDERGCEKPAAAKHDSRTRSRFDSQLEREEKCRFTFQYEGCSITSECI